MSTLITTTNGTPNRRNYFIIFLMLYFILSGFSVWELEHLTPMLSSNITRVRLLIAFGVTVLLPVMLHFMVRTTAIKLIGWGMEFGSVAIILFFYKESVNHLNKDASQVCDVVAMLISDIISSVVLYISHNQKK